MRRPNSDKKSTALLLMGPRVSQAIGIKMYERANSEYFTSFLPEALSAALPGSWDVMGRWDAAKVSATVTSHIKFFPACQGMRVIPSGRLPSVLESPDGSLEEGMQARVSPLQIKSFK